MMLDIRAFMDHVEIEGVKVLRPRHVPRSWWLRFWEQLAS